MCFDSFLSDVSANMGNLRGSESFNAEFESAWFNTISLQIMPHACAGCIIYVVSGVWGPVVP